MLKDQCSEYQIQYNTQSPKQLTTVAMGNPTETKANQMRTGLTPWMSVKCIILVAEQKLAGYASLLRPCCCPRKLQFPAKHPEDKFLKYNLDSNGL